MTPTCTIEFCLDDFIAQVREFETWAAMAFKIAACAFSWEAKADLVGFVVEKLQLIFPFECCQPHQTCQEEVECFLSAITEKREELSKLREFYMLQLEYN